LEGGKKERCNSKEGEKKKKLATNCHLGKKKEERLSNRGRKPLYLYRNPSRMIPSSKGRRRGHSVYSIGAKRGKKREGGKKKKGVREGKKRVFRLLNDESHCRRKEGKLLFPLHGKGED